MINFGEEYYNYTKKENNCDYKVKGEWQKDYAKFIKQYFKEFINKKCLDFGCALGANTSALKDIGFDIIGLDVDKWYKENTPFKNINIETYNPDNPIFPFEDDYFDFIHSHQVIEHIKEEKIDNIFKELNRVCKLNGILYISTTQEDKNGIKYEPTHYSCLSEKAWINYFKKAGFKNISKKYPTLVNNEKAIEYKWVQFVFKKIKNI